MAQINFIEVDCIDGSTMLINVNQIAYIKPSEVSECECTIYFMAHDKITVKNTIYEIENKIFYEGDEMDKNVYMQTKYILADYKRTLSLKVYTDYITEQIDAVEYTVTEANRKYKEKTYGGFDVIKAFFDYDYFNYMHIRKDINDIGPSKKTWQRFKNYIVKQIAVRLGLV